jgi:hypothetical protein
MDPEAWLAHACEIANRDLTLEEWTTYFGAAPYQETCAGR